MRADAYRKPRGAMGSSPTRAATTARPVPTPRNWGGVEPVGAPKLKRSLEAGHPVRLERTASIADGLITLGVGDIPFAQLAAQRDRVAGVALVEDDMLWEAVHFLWQHCHLAVEPSGAATTAAVRSGAVHPVPPTVLVVSGGNVDPSLLEA